jgi:hypothetical protein
MKTIAMLDMFRNAAAPMVGNEHSVFKVSGSCLSAQVIPFHPESFDELSIRQAVWRITWLPNISNGAQTAIRLVSALSGPAAIAPIIATYSGGKPNTPLNEAYNVTSAINELLMGTPPSFFQLFTESAGDGTHAPLIYSSALEVIFGSAGVAT